jgi:origin recognition complex subunit 1
MDELDQLLTAKQDVVYNFFNWPTMRDSQLFVIAVANRMDLPQHLAAKIKSRLGAFLILYRVIWRLLYCISLRPNTLLAAQC